MHTRREPGAVPETTALLEQQWDFIFFTGSPRVGKIIHQAAAKHLTPAVLELGGKNPTIVHSSADIKVAARRIANMRFSNGGQICTAPDHVLVWPEVKDELVEHLAQAVRDFYGEEPQQSPDYGHTPTTASRGTSREGGLTVHPATESLLELRRPRSLSGRDSVGHSVCSGLRRDLFVGQPGWGRGLVCGFSSSLPVCAVARSGSNWSARSAASALWRLWVQADSHPDPLR